MLNLGLLGLLTILAICLLTVMAVALITVLVVVLSRSRKQQDEGNRGNDR